MVKAMLLFSFVLILFCVVLLSKSTLIVMQSKCMDRANKTNWRNWIHWWWYFVFCSANKNLLGHPVLCVYYTAWLFTDWHLHLNSREKGVGFSLFFWLFWWSCVSSSSISANCAYCASFSKEQQQLAEVHFCCSSALLRPTRGVKKANFPENLAKHNRSKTEQRDEKPIFIQYFI